MIYIGDTVRVKTWEELEEEFGFENILVGDEQDQVIDCLGYFTSSMKVLCGKVFEVTDIQSNQEFCFINSEIPFKYDRYFGLEEADKMDTIITEEMLKVM